MAFRSIKNDFDSIHARKTIRIDRRLIRDLPVGIMSTDDARSCEAPTPQGQRENCPGTRGTTGAKVAFCPGTILPPICSVIKCSYGNYHILFITVAYGNCVFASVVFMIVYRSENNYCYLSTISALLILLYFT